METEMDVELKMCFPTLATMDTFISLSDRFRHRESSGLLLHSDLKTGKVPKKRVRQRKRECWFVKWRGRAGEAYLKATLEAKTMIRITLMIDMMMIPSIRTALPRVYLEEGKGKRYTRLNS